MDKKDIRKQFKEDVFKRDKYTCKVCGQTKDANKLNAHHITDRHEMPNGGYVKENGITVCEDECHMIVETFHVTGGKDWCEGLHPDELYAIIGSSKELAIEKSNLL